MPSLSVSSLLGLLGNAGSDSLLATAAPSTSGASSQSDGFDSLLSIGDNASDGGQNDNASSSSQQSQNNNQGNKTPDPIAVAVEVPTTIFASNKTQVNNSAPASQTSAASAPPAENTPPSAQPSDNTPPAQPSENTPPPAHDSQNSSQATAPAPGNAPAKPAQQDSNSQPAAAQNTNQDATQQQTSAAGPATIAVAAVPAVPAALVAIAIPAAPQTVSSNATARASDTNDTGSKSVNDQLGALLQSLYAIVQTLSPVAVAAPVQLATPLQPATTDTAADSTISAASTTVTGTVQTQSPLALVQNIQSILQKLSALTPDAAASGTSDAAASGTSTDTSTATTAISVDTTDSASATVSSDTTQSNDLQTLLASLKTDMTALQLLAPTAGTNASIPLTNASTPLTNASTPLALPTAQPAAAPAQAAPANALSALDDTQLSTLKTALDATTALAKTVAARPAAQTANNIQQPSVSFFGDSLFAATNSKQTLHTPVVTVVPGTQDSMTNSAATAATSSLQAVQTTIDTSVPQIATFVAASQSTTDTNSGSGHSGSGDQNGNASAPLAGMQSTGGAQATNDAAPSAFSKLLTQPAAGASLTDQVAFQIKTAAADGSSKIHIQLDPADLGKLDIKLSVDANGKTGVVITADNKNTLDLLQRDSTSLTRALSDAGLRTDGGSLNFNLRGGQDGNGGQGNNQAAMTYQKASTEEEDTTPLQVTSRSYVVNLNEGLDIRI